MPTTSTTSSHGLGVTAYAGLPCDDGEGITEDGIRAVVEEFYRRACRDDWLGPVFEAHVEEWEGHLRRMTDFWSAALLRTGRYSGHPVEVHRAIEELSAGHFDRWLSLFEDTVRDLCPPTEAEAYLIRVRRMGEGMTRSLGLASRPEPAASILRPV
jgi:hemoglobin